MNRKSKVILIIIGILLVIVLLAYFYSQNNLDVYSVNLNIIELTQNESISVLEFQLENTGIGQLSDVVLFLNGNESEIIFELDVLNIAESIHTSVVFSTPGDPLTEIIVSARLSNQNTFFQTNFEINQ